MSTQANLIPQVNTRTLSVSVCIPIFNRAHLVRDTIESILGQAYLPKEVLVFDNCSDDDVEHVVRQFDSPLIRFHRHSSNIGMCGNWNACINAATGDVITLLHSDDWYADEQALSRAVCGFEQHPDACVVYSMSAPSDSVVRDARADYKEYRRGPEAAMHVYRMGQLPCSSTFYRATSLRLTTGFAERFSTCCDEEFNSRMALLGNVVCCSVPFAVYRRHDGHVMFDMWLRPEFLEQYFESRVEMAVNAGIARDVAVLEVEQRVVDTLWASARMAFRKNRAPVARAVHRCIRRLRPSEYRKVSNQLQFVLHHVPGGQMARRGYEAVKRAAKSLLHR